MITLAVRLKNLAFLVIAVLVLGYLGVRYADLGHYVGLRSYYTVTVQLPQTGGLYTHSNVTYRGVSVGRVGPIELTENGVEAELRIEKDAPRIPDSLTAVVANLSAVGEQYVDLRPTRTEGPFLGNGSVIDEADTTIPAPPTDVLTSVDDLASSVNPESLRTVVEEFGAAFEGRGDDLQVLLDTSGDFIETADQALPVTTRLMADGEQVLRTQAEQGKALKGFARGAKELAAELKGSDADLRRLIATTPDAAVQISGLLRDVDPAFGVVVANLLTTSEVAVTRQRGLEELLVKLPAVAAAGASAVDDDGARFGMSVTFFEPLPCTAGYGGTVYRNGLNTSAGPAVNTAARCTSSPGTGINVRGSANAPKGGPVPKPAVPGSMKLPGTVDGAPAASRPPAEDMAGLLGLGGGS
ncbi:ABC transporter substrate-binding protein [Streptomyces sp. TSRI0445]|uniref:MCE family protein n=1 Tax=Streptomyces TaxID=1883 RepID=UPI00093C35E1|nr:MULTISPECIES: MlaD family protein [Streptomyces]WSF75385.1 MCE family protein [Streptomyces globisporus]OKI68123.1 ABC transporter substrate-binding protein [Streptomyces sp. TSRI0445]UIZ16580.1 MCE family protein [Streptomyces sp. R527F]WSQ90485.1 MCE family protein [Streptomyces globisporus]WSU79786.1 MCE family protein [Streptomyces globisporus]